MKRSQWLTLSIASYIGMGWFIRLDSGFWSCLNLLSEKLGSYDVWCIVNGEIYEPFIYLTFGLGIVFSICFLLEPKIRRLK